jgi:N-methylhydantoinase B
MIADNTRIPHLVVGDMRAQVAAAKLGAQRFRALVDRHGLDTVRASAGQLMDHSERVLRQRIAELPDGTYEAEGLMDGFLDHPDPAYRNLRVRVAVTIAGSAIEVDLTGTSNQVDLPINMPFEGTVDIAILVTLRSILLDSALHGPVATNGGLFRPIAISAPEGSLANPRFPAPTIARFCPGNVIADTLMRALAPIVPDSVAAGVGNLKVVAYSGEVDGRAWVYMDILEGSYGGRLGKDGLDAVDTLYANTRNNPIEDIESHYPLRVSRYELTGRGAGQGRWRGGFGSVRDIGFEADGGFSIEGDGNAIPPPGLFGGEPGTPGAVVLNPGTEDEVSLPSKIPYRKARAGDVLRLVGPSGGGYGDAAQRDPAAIRRDELDDLAPGT